jgi:hypothetical protein
MAYRSICLIADGAISKEADASGSITPGMLIEKISSGKVRAHGSAGCDAQRMFAVENDLVGSEIGTAYTDGNKVLYKVFQPGNEVYARLTTSQTIAIGDYLESNGDGNLRKHASDSAGVVEYPEGIVGIAQEAVTTTSSVARIVVEII